MKKRYLDFTFVGYTKLLYVIMIDMGLSVTLHAYFDSSSLLGMTKYLKALYL